MLSMRLSLIVHATPRAHLTHAATATPTSHPAADAILGVYSDAQSECAARLLPEDRLGEVRVRAVWQLLTMYFKQHTSHRQRAWYCWSGPQTNPRLLACSAQYTTQHPMETIQYCCLFFLRRCEWSRWCGGAWRGTAWCRSVRIGHSTHRTLCWA